MRLSPIISMYVARYFALAFIATLCAIIGVTLLFDSIELLRRLSGDGNAGFFVVIEMALLKMPQMLSTVMPFAVMLGAMIVFWRLTRTNELVVIRAVGVSAWQFLAPVLIVVVLFGCFNLAVLNPLAATMYRQYERMEDSLQLRVDNPLTISSGGLWMREATPGGQAVIHATGVRQIDGRLKMQRISLLSLAADGALISRYEAAFGEIEDHLLTLSDVWVLKAGEPSRHAETITQPTSLTLSKIQEKFSSPASLSFWELPGFIKFFESAGFSAHRHLLQWHSLLASPLLLVAMVFVAAVFSLNPNMRKGGLLLRVVAGVGVGFGFYFFTRITYALGMSSTLPVFLAAWSPVVVTLLIALAVLFHQEDG
jgi:lipopolysaccharide export system permease protein